MSKRKHYEMDFYLSECKSFLGLSPNVLVQFCLAKPNDTVYLLPTKERSGKQFTQSLARASKILAVPHKVRTH